MVETVGCVVTISMYNVHFSMKKNHIHYCGMLLLVLFCLMPLQIESSWKVDAPKQIYCVEPILLSDK